MIVVLTVLKTVFLFLLVLLGLVLLLTMLILFVPIRYEFRFCLEDPEAHEEADADRLSEQICFLVHFSWMGGLLQGGIRWPEETLFSLQFLCWKTDISSLLEKFPSGEKEEKKDDGGLSTKEPRHGSIREAAETGKRLLKRLQTKDSSGRSLLRQLLGDAGDMARPLLPTQWELSGTLGLGDPEATAAFLELEGILMPFAAGHLWVVPEPGAYRFDLRAQAKGSIRLIRVTAAALRMVWRVFLKKDALLRRIPAAE